MVFFQDNIFFWRRFSREYSAAGFYFSVHSGKTGLCWPRLILSQNTECCPNTWLESFFLFLLFSGVIFKNTKWYSNTFQLLSWLTWLYLLEVRTCQLPRKSQPSNCIISYSTYCVKYYWTRWCFLKAVFWYYFVKNCSPPSCRKEIARRWLGRSTVQQSLHPPKKKTLKKNMKSLLTAITPTIWKKRWKVW